MTVSDADIYTAGIQNLQDGIPLMNKVRLISSIGVCVQLIQCSAFGNSKLLKCKDIRNSVGLTVIITDFRHFSK